MDISLPLSQNEIEAAIAEFDRLWQLPSAPEVQERMELLLKLFENQDVSNSEHPG